MALRAARDVDRPLDLEEPALVVERAHLARVDVATARPVGDDRIVVPAIPQPSDDIDELVGDLVAQLVLHVPLAAEIERGPGLGAGHHVPGGATGADMVDRGKRAGDMVGLAKTGRDRRAKPDVAGWPAAHPHQPRRLAAA